MAKKSKEVRETKKLKYKIRYRSFVEGQEVI